MPFTQTAATTINDVISQVCQYAVDHAGFTWENSTTVGGNTVYRISKGGIYWSFRYDTNTTTGGTQYRIKCWMTTSLVTNVDPTFLVGQRTPSSVSFWNFPGPFPALYIYTEGTCIHMVLEVTTGVFTHMSFGKITKIDTFIGGEYLTGNSVEYRPSNGTWYPYQFNISNDSPIFCGDEIIGSTMPTDNNGRYVSSFHSYIRNVLDVPPANENGNFARMGQYIDGQISGMCGPNGMTSRIFRDTPNVGTLRSIVLPMYATIRDPVSRLCRLSGYVPDVRLVPMKYLNPGEVILNDWQVFPFVAKESDKVNYPETANWGLAYKKTP